MTVNGSHIAPLLGGPIGQSLGWRWYFKFAAICDGVMLIVIVSRLAETLDIRPKKGSREDHPKAKYKVKSFVEGPRIRDQTKDTPLRWNQFVISTFRTVAQPDVVFTSIYYATQYGFASILPAVTVASSFSKEFKWDTLQIRLGYGGALTIEGSLRKLVAGSVR